MYIAISYGSFAVAVPDLQIRGGGGGGVIHTRKYERGPRINKEAFKWYPLIYRSYHYDFVFNTTNIFNLKGTSCCFTAKVQESIIEYPFWNE